MNTTTVATADVIQPGIGTTIVTVREKDFAHQAYMILRFGFAALPIIAGLDKFFDRLGNWDVYLASPIANLATKAGLSSHGFMQGVGVIEIVAGLLVAFKPKLGAYVVAAWLVGIIVNFMLVPGYYDVALRDFGLFLGAIALARLSQEY